MKKEKDIHPVDAVKFCQVINHNKLGQILIRLTGDLDDNGDAIIELQLIYNDDITIANLAFPPSVAIGVISSLTYEQIEEKACQIIKQIQAENG